MSLNPYGRVPTLEEDGFVLFESTAILNYLEATRPHGPSELKPSKAIARTLLLSWCRCVAAKAAQDRGHIDRKLMGGHRTERALRSCVPLQSSQAANLLTGIFSTLFAARAGPHEQASGLGPPAVPGQYDGRL